MTPQKFNNDRLPYSGPVFPNCLTNAHQQLGILNQDLSKLYLQRLADPTLSIFYAITVPLPVFIIFVC